MTTDEIIKRADEIIAIVNGKNYDGGMSRKEIDLMRLYNRVLITFGIVNQTFMLVEECAELLNAVAKMKRDRASKEDIITELADVSIMVEQLAFFYGWDEFKEERERKLKRLEDRINHHTANENIKQKGCEK